MDPVHVDRFSYVMQEIGKWLSWVDTSCHNNNNLLRSCHNDYPKQYIKVYNKNEDKPLENSNHGQLFRPSLGSSGWYSLYVELKHCGSAFSSDNNYYINKSLGSQLLSCV